MRMEAIWALAQVPGADVCSLLFALDAHFPALCYAEAPDATMKGLYTAGLQPNSDSLVVYSCLNVATVTRSLAMETVKPTPVMAPFYTSAGQKQAATSAEQKLFAQASINCRSVRYIADRFMACKDSRDAQMVAGCFLLGAYSHAAPAELLFRKRVYSVGSTVQLLTSLNLTSRELHEALVEFCAVQRQPSLSVVELPEWKRARLRAWGQPLGPCRAKVSRRYEIPSSPVSRIATAAISSVKWTLSREQQTVVTASMQQKGPPTLWRAIEEAEHAFGCLDELKNVALNNSAAKPRLSVDGMLAASAVLRRLALKTCAVSPSIERLQREALFKNKKCTTMLLSICTHCCTLCTAPQGQCPVPAGLRVDLSDGTTSCIRCNTGDGLMALDFVGKIVTFATPTMQLVSVVVCGSCGVAMRLLSKNIWGTVPLCEPCFGRCKETVCEPHTCWCGRPAGAHSELFGAVDDDGRDVVTASCSKHAHLSIVVRPRLSDLRLLYGKR